MPGDPQDPTRGWHPDQELMPPTNDLFVRINLFRAQKLRFPSNPVSMRSCIDDALDHRTEVTSETWERGVGGFCPLTANELKTQSGICRLRCVYYKVRQVGEDGGLLPLHHAVGGKGLGLAGRWESVRVAAACISQVSWKREAAGQSRRESLAEGDGERQLAAGCSLSGRESVKSSEVMPPGSLIPWAVASAASLSRCLPTGSVHFTWLHNNVGEEEGSWGGYFGVPSIP